MVLCWNESKPEEDGMLIFHAVAAAKLVLRLNAALESPKCGHIYTGQQVTVLQQVTIGDTATVRAKVGSDSSPRGATTRTLGWVTMMKDGELKLKVSREPGPGLTTSALSTAAERLATLRKSHDPSFSRLDSGIDSSRWDGESMAKRIARRRRERRQSIKTMGALAAETSEGPSIVEMVSVKKAMPKFTMLSAAQLMEDHDRAMADAAANEAATFDTVASRLGQVLVDKKVTVSELMKEWDRNHDGAISKQEFRLNVRNLGMTDADAPTKELDALYDTFDTTGSGELDVDELKKALQKLKNELVTVSVEKTKHAHFAERRRKIGGLLLEAVESTRTYEAERQKLTELRRGSVASRLGALLKSQNIKVSELVAQWDTNGNSMIDAAEFREKAKALGLEATDAELDKCFKSLDHHGLGDLDLRDMVNAFKKLMSASLEAKKKEHSYEKVVKKAHKQAEAEQLSLAESIRQIEEEDAANGFTIVTPFATLFWGADAPNATPGRPVPAEQVGHAEDEL